MNIMQAWRIWIYYRLSRDDDKEMNSLKKPKTNFDGLHRKEWVSVRRRIIR